MAILEVQPNDTRNLQNVADSLANAKKIIVITGAGISTNCGIPDFRSENGLYSLIQGQHDRAFASSDCRTASPVLDSDRQSTNYKKLPSPQKLPIHVKGKELFDSQLWSNSTSTSVFYRFISSLREKIKHDVKHTTATHRFIRTLRDKRKLVRCYTQNIDGLETRERMTTDLELGKGNRQRFTKKSMERPLIPKHQRPGGEFDAGCEVVQLHGELENLRCTLCLQKFSWDAEHSQYTKSLLEGKAPLCHSCLAKSQDRKDRGRRETKVGTLRPNIILYGEEHPSADLLGSIAASDLALSPDLLLILGTSLNVHGLKTMVREFAKSVHARPRNRGRVIFVNLSKPAESVWKGVIDTWVDMDCDVWVHAMKKHRPDLFLAQEELKLPVKKPIKTLPSEKPVLFPLSVEAEKENLVASHVSIPMLQPKAGKPNLVSSIAPKRPFQQHGSKEEPGPGRISPMFSPKRAPPSVSSGTETLTLKRKRSTLMENLREISQPTSKRRKALVKVWTDVGAGT